MVGCVVAHNFYPNDLEVAPVHTKDVITAQAKDSSLYDLCPSPQFPKPAKLLEVTDQVNKTKIRK